MKPLFFPLIIIGLFLTVTGYSKKTDSKLKEEVRGIKGDICMDLQGIEIFSNLIKEAKTTSPAAAEELVSNYTNANHEKKREIKTLQSKLVQLTGSSFSVSHCKSAEKLSPRFSDLGPDLQNPRATIDRIPAPKLLDIYCHLLTSRSEQQGSLRSLSSDASRSEETVAQAKKRLTETEEEIRWHQASYEKATGTPLKSSVCD